MPDVMEAICNVHDLSSSIQSESLPRQWPTTLQKQSKSIPHVCGYLSWVFSPLPLRFKCWNNIVSLGTTFMFYTWSSRNSTLDTSIHNGKNRTFCKLRSVVMGSDEHQWQLERMGGGFSYILGMLVLTYLNRGGEGSVGVLCQHIFITE